MTGVKSAKDILKAADLRAGEARLLLGGPPCQPFSKSDYWADGDPLRRVTLEPILSLRASRLRNYEELGRLHPIPETELRAAVGAQRWESYWERLEEIKRLMFAAPGEADRIRTTLEEKFGDSPGTLL